MKPAAYSTTIRSVATSLTSEFFAAASLGYFFAFCAGLLFGGGSFSGNSSCRRRLGTAPRTHRTHLPVIRHGPTWGAGSPPPVTGGLFSSLTVTFFAFFELAADGAAYFPDAVVGDVFLPVCRRRCARDAAPRCRARRGSRQDTERTDGPGWFWVHFSHPPARR